jgi:alkanesulfonate monooxygenase
VLSGYPHLEEAVRVAELVFPLLGKKSFVVSNNVTTGGAFDVPVISHNVQAASQQKVA